MNERVGIDSNILTYFLQVISPYYDPSGHTDVATQRVAILRSFLYGGSTFCLPPTVRDEYLQIWDDLQREEYELLHNVLLLDLPREPVPEALLARKTYLLQFHRKISQKKQRLSNRCRSGTGRPRHSSFSRHKANKAPTNSCKINQLDGCSRILEDSRYTEGLPTKNSAKAVKPSFRQRLLEMVSKFSKELGKI